MFVGDKCNGGIESEAESRIEIPGLRNYTILFQGTKKVFLTGHSNFKVHSRLKNSSRTIILMPQFQRKKNPCRNSNPLTTFHSS